MAKYEAAANLHQPHVYYSKRHNKFLMSFTIVSEIKIKTTNLFWHGGVCQQVFKQKSSCSLHRSRIQGQPEAYSKTMSKNKIKYKQNLNRLKSRCL